jgi:hypothetical protein
LTSVVIIYISFEEYRSQHSEFRMTHGSRCISVML